MLLRSVCIAAMSAAMLAGCSSGSSDSPSGGGGGSGITVTVEGGFGDAGAMEKLRPYYAPDLGALAMPAGSWKVVCIAASNPSKTYQDDVDADGLFAVAMNNVAPGTSIGCLLMKDQIFYGSFIFGNEKNLSGNDVPKASLGIHADTTSVKLGTNLIAGGQITVSAPVVDGSQPSTLSMGDESGNWKVINYGKVADGFTHPCDMDYNPADPKEKPLHDACMSSDWGKFFINMAEFKDSGKTRHTFALWHSESQFNICGKTQGLTTTWTQTSGFGKSPNAKAAFDFDYPDLTNVDSILANAPFVSSGRADRDQQLCNQILGAVIQGNDEDADANRMAVCKPVLDKANGTCADFAWNTLFGGISDSEEQKAARTRAKLVCVTHRMSSGGYGAYASPADECGPRLEKGFQNLHAATLNTGLTPDGCASDDCGDGDVKWERDPRSLRLAGEITLNGSVGSGTAVEIWDSGEVCEIKSTIEYNLAKTATNKMALSLIMTRVPHGAFDAEDCQAQRGPGEWAKLQTEIQIPTKMMFELQKQ